MVDTMHQVVERDFERRVRGRYRMENESVESVLNNTPNDYPDIKQNVTSEWRNSLTVREVG